MLAHANMLLLIWLFPGCVFVRSRFRVCGCSCAALSENLFARPKVCSSTDLLHLLENRLRCPGIDLSAVSVALLELSMALGKSHAILDGLLPFQKRVSVLSDLPSSVVLFD